MRFINVSKHFFMVLGFMGLMISCDEDNDSLPPVGPDLRGSDWTGLFARTDRPENQGITARIQQDGNAVTLQTDRESGPGRMITGTIDEEGFFEGTDADTGDFWFTAFSKATPTRIKLAGELLDQRGKTVMLLDLTRKAL